MTRILKDIRESTGLTDRDLSALSGVSRTSIYYLERERIKNPSPVMIDRLIYELSKYVELSYIAGLVDRASSITITKNKAGHTNTSKYPHYIARFTVGSKHKEIAELVRRVLGVGSVTTLYEKIDGKKVPYRYNYYAHCVQSGQALEKLFPYLKIKREKAKILLEFRELMTKNHKAHQLFYRQGLYNGNIANLDEGFDLSNTRGTWDQEAINLEYEKYYQEIRK